MRSWMYTKLAAHDALHGALLVLTIIWYRPVLVALDQDY
jgi:hypothetical protein